MSLLDYDYDELARQVQRGLERIGVNFLRSHGARIKKDLVDFHGFEQIDLELRHGPHTLTLRQVGRPRGPALEDIPLPAGAPDESFESLFDGWPAEDAPTDLIALWLASLPAGQAPPERKKPDADPANPFATENKPPVLRPEPEVAFNPFLADAPRRADVPNPFAESDRDARRRDALRWLKDDD